MRRFRRLSQILRGGGFSFHTRIGCLFRIGFSTQCYILAAAATGAIFSASIADDSLVLPKPNIGLLQHPGIWAFICLQVVLPISLRYSLRQLFGARGSLRTLGVLDDRPSRGLLAPLLSYLKLEDPKSKILAACLYCFGLIAFVWNTYQNQLPGTILPFDFWDSKTYSWGFWVTRVYKLYLFVWLLPYIAFLHISILRIPLRLIRKARLEGKLKLLPFHPDGTGGLGFLPDLITRPILVGTLFSTLPAAAEFYIHRTADITPTMGLIGLIASATVAYFVPILALRTDILAAKRAMVEKLKWMQQTSFSQVFESPELDFDVLKSNKDAIDTYDKLCVAVKAISTFPHLRRLFAIIVLATSPAAISLITKSLQFVGPFIQHWLAKP